MLIKASPVMLCLASWCHFTHLFSSCLVPIVVLQTIMPVDVKFLILPPAMRTIRKVVCLSCVCPERVKYILYNSVSGFRPRLFRQKNPCLLICLNFAQFFHSSFICPSFFIFLSLWPSHLFRCEFQLPAGRSPPSDLCLAHQPPWVCLHLSLLVY